MKLNSVLNFILESGVLKSIARSGWQVIGIKNGESVAEHCFRCAIIGYLLAGMEGANMEKTAVMCLFNDIAETRIGDLHKMSQKYINLYSIEEKIFEEQVSLLPKKTEKELLRILREYKIQRTKESIIARDADILECLIQAKEYYDQGLRQAQKFMKKAPFFLRTKSAKELWNLVKRKDTGKWWLRLSTFKR